MKNRQFTFAISSQVHDVFHLNIDITIQDGKIKLKELDKTKWDEIKSKIRINPKLSQEKAEQLWELLEQFLDAFVWHKGKLGCYKLGEHVIDRRGFPPCRTFPSKLSFQEEDGVKGQIDVFVMFRKMKPNTFEYTCRVTLLIKKDSSC